MDYGEEIELFADDINEFLESLKILELVPK